MGLVLWVQPVFFAPRMSANNRHKNQETSRKSGITMKYKLHKDIIAIIVFVMVFLILWLFFR